MEWHGREEKKQPQERSKTSDMLQIAQTWYTDVKPYASPVCMYKLVSVWCAENLHAVVASAQQKRTEHVDYQVDPDVQCSQSGTAALKESPNRAFCFLIRTSPNVDGDSEIETEYQ